MLRINLKLALSLLFFACETSDWEELKFTEIGSVNYISKNNEGDGFIIREGMLVATSEKFLAVLDSGKRYPYELQFTAGNSHFKYKGQTGTYYKHNGILLVHDLAPILARKSKFLEGLEKAEDITLIINNSNRPEEQIRYKTKTRGLRKIIAATKVRGVSE